MAWEQEEIIKLLEANTADLAKHALMLIRNLIEEHETDGECIDMLQDVVAGLRKSVDELLEESEKLKITSEEAVRSFTRLETLYKLKCKELESAKNDALCKMREKFAIRFGTYLSTDMISLKGVFNLMQVFTDEILNEQTEEI